MLYIGGKIQIRGSVTNFIVYTYLHVVQGIYYAKYSKATIVLSFEWAECFWLVCSVIALSTYSRVRRWVLVSTFIIVLTALACMKPQEHLVGQLVIYFLNIDFVNYHLVFCVQDTIKLSSLHVTSHFCLLDRQHNCWKFVRWLTIIIVLACFNLISSWC